MTEPSNSLFPVETQREMEADAATVSSRVGTRRLLLVAGIAGFWTFLLIFVFSGMIVGSVQGADPGQRNPIITAVFWVIVVVGSLGSAASAANKDHRKGFAPSRFRETLRTVPPAALAVLETMLNRALKTYKVKTVSSVAIENDGVLSFKFPILQGIGVAFVASVAASYVSSLYIGRTESKATANPTQTAPIAKTETAPKLPDTVQSTPLPVAEQEPAPLKPFLAGENYISSGDAVVHQFSLNRPAMVKLLVEIEGNVPVDVATTQGFVTASQWMVAGELATVAELAEGLGGGNSSSVFSNGLSKKGSYRRFESQWVHAPAGDYTAIIDNTNAFTPARGDAVVLVSIFAK